MHEHMFLGKRNAQIEENLGLQQVARNQNMQIEENQDIELEEVALESHAEVKLNINIRKVLGLKELKPENEINIISAATFFPEKNTYRKNFKIIKYSKDKKGFYYYDPKKIKDSGEEKIDESKDCNLSINKLVDLKGKATSFLPNQPVFYAQNIFSNSIVFMQFTYKHSQEPLMIVLKANEILTNSNKSSHVNSDEIIKDIRFIPKATGNAKNDAEFKNEQILFKKMKIVPSGLGKTIKLLDPNDSNSLQEFIFSNKNYKISVSAYGQLFEHRLAIQISYDLDKDTTMNFAFTVNACKNYGHYIRAHSSFIPATQNKFFICLKSNRVQIFKYIKVQEQFETIDNFSLPKDIDEVKMLIKKFSKNGYTTNFSLIVNTSKTIESNVLTKRFDSEIKNLQISFKNSQLTREQIKAKINIEKQTDREELGLDFKINEISFYIKKAEEISLENIYLIKKLIESKNLVNNIEYYKDTTKINKNLLISIFYCKEYKDKMQSKIEQNCKKYDSNKSILNEIIFVMKNHTHNKRDYEKSMMNLGINIHKNKTFTSFNKLEQADLLDLKQQIEELNIGKKILDFIFENGEKDMTNLDIKKQLKKLDMSNDFFQHLCSNSKHFNMLRYSYNIEYMSVEETKKCFQDFDKALLKYIFSSIEQESDMQSKIQDNIEKLLNEVNEPISKHIANEIYNSLIVYEISFIDFENRIKELFNMFNEKISKDTKMYRSLKQYLMFQFQEKTGMSIDKELISEIYLLIKRAKNLDTVIKKVMKEIGIKEKVEDQTKETIKNQMEELGIKEKTINEIMDYIERKGEEKKEEELEFKKIEEELGVKKAIDQIYEDDKLILKKAYDFFSINEDAIKVIRKNKEAEKKMQVDKNIIQMNEEEIKVVCENKKDMDDFNMISEDRIVERQVNEDRMNEEYIQPICDERDMYSDMSQ